MHADRNHAHDDLDYCVSKGRCNTCTFESTHNKRSCTAITVAGLEECQTRCLAFTRCAGYVYEASGTKCWFKSVLSDVAGFTTVTGSQVGQCSQGSNDCTCTVMEGHKITGHVLKYNHNSVGDPKDGHYLLCCSKGKHLGLWGKTTMIHANTPTTTPFLSPTSLPTSPPPSHPSFPP